MTRPFNELIKNFSRERQERISDHADALLRENRLLKALRQEQGLSQTELAALMGIRQASVSKLENQKDMQLSTLRKYVTALGGELEINVRFEDKFVNISSILDPPSQN